MIDLGFGNPDIPSPGDRRREAPRGRAAPREPPLLRSRGLPQLRAALAELYQRRFGVTLDPETQVVATIGAKEALVAPDVGAGRAGRRGDRAVARATRSISSRPCSPARRPSRRSSPRRSPTRSSRRTSARCPGPGRDPVLPAQPDHGDRDPRGSAAARRLRARARRAARARLRLRGHRLRRLPAALAARDPGRARLQRRAVQPDEVVLDGRLARRLRRRPRRRGRARSRSSSRTSTTAPSSRSRSPRSSRCARLPTTPTRCARSTAAGATRCAPASTAPAGTSSRRRRRCSSGRRSPSAFRELRLARVRVELARERRRRRQPRRRLRQARRGLRALRAGRERAADRAGDAQHPPVSAATEAPRSRPRDCAFRRRADERRVLRERALAVTRLGRTPFEQPPVELVVVDLDVHRARLDVDA